MKPQYFGLLVGFLSVVALALLFGGTLRPEGPAAAETAQTRTITVTGEGEVRVQPDMVMVTVSIWTHGASAADAEALHRAFVKQVEGAMTAAGADAGQFEVVSETVTTRAAPYDSGMPQVSGYETRTSVRALVRNPSRSQAVAEAALEAGALSVESVAYGLQNPEETKRLAMKQALENARERAAALVKAGGDKLGAIRTIEALPVSSPAPQAGSADSVLFRAEVRATFSY